MFWYIRTCFFLLQGNGHVGHCNQGNNMYLFPGLVPLIHRLKELHTLFTGCIKKKWVSYIVKFLYVVLDLAFFYLVLPLSLTGCFRLLLSGKLFSFTYCNLSFIVFISSKAELGDMKHNYGPNSNNFGYWILPVNIFGWCHGLCLHHRNSDQCSWIRCKTRIKEVMEKNVSCFVNMGYDIVTLNNCSLAAYMSEEEVLKGIIYPPISR